MPSGRLTVSNRWMEAIQECQEVIAASEPHPHYMEAYRAEEAFYWRRIPQWLLKDFRRRAFERCLDIGCAYGTLALFCKKLFECDVFCTDFTDTYISPRLLRDFGLHFAKNNIELDPFPWDLKFDVILFTEVWEHLNFNPLPTLEKIRNLLSPNGRLYLSTPNAARWGRVSKYYGSVEEMPLPAPGHTLIDDHVYVYQKNEMMGLLKKAGFRTERFGYSPGMTNRRHFNLTLAVD
jgi:SAM-dependent methyltransferase